MIVVVFINENKHPAPDDEYNYYDSLQVCLTEGIGH